MVGSLWEARNDYYPQIWAFDFGGSDHGPIHWGQFGGGPKNSHCYEMSDVIEGINVEEDPKPGGDTNNEAGENFAGGSGGGGCYINTLSIEDVKGK